MLVALLLSHALLAAAPAPAQRGPALRTIELDPKRPKAVYEIHTAPGLSTTIQFPEPWAVMPVCGDCVFGDAEPRGQLFRLDVTQETRTLNIKPTRLPGRDVPPSAFLTNVDVTLEGGLAITLFVKLTLPEDADARVEFKVPEAEMGAAKLTKKEKELEAQFAARVDDAAAQKMLSAFMAGTKCRDFMGRPTRSDSLVVRLKQMCRNGALLYVVFEAENRSRNDAQIQSAILADASGATSSLAKLDKTVLHFNDSSVGVAAMPIADPSLPPSVYTLTITEDGGKDRTVVVEGIEF